jgi:predicted metal-dependent hydrolase
MELNIGGLKINYEVRRSSKASKPRIDHKLGNFTVVIPESQDHDAEELLQRKGSWVSKKRKEFLRFQRKIPERKIEEGESISILGTEKQIILEKRRSNEVSDNIYLAEHLVERTTLEDQVKKALKSKARDIIEAKVEEYENNVGGVPNKIFIRDQKTKWGSCSGKQNLNFNWRLILGPKHVLEYVVVHELVHLDIKKHNEEFWSRVREIFPEYKKANRWLSDNSSQLVYNKDLIENSH